MTIQSAKSTKIVPKRFSLAEIEEASETMSGFCIACGAQRDCCEPDARRYHCEECDKNHVYGADEIFLMGLVED